MTNPMEMLDAQNSEHGYQVIVCNIKYGGKVLNNKIHEKPDITVLDIPEDILKTKKNDQKFKDNIETFVYKTISRKYGKEVSYCQIWLPEE